MKTLSISTAATLALILAACSPSPEAQDAGTAAPTESAAEAVETAHEDDDAAEPTAEDHGHEHADGEDADHEH
jgi:ABC-type Zn2+ transport system substrate-binding protein/surface adhesin